MWVQNWSGLWNAAWSSECIENWQKDWWSNLSIKSGWTSATPLSGDSGISHQSFKNGWIWVREFMSQEVEVHTKGDAVCTHVSSGGTEKAAGVVKGLRTTEVFLEWEPHSISNIEKLFKTMFHISKWHTGDISSLTTFIIIFVTDVIFSFSKWDMNEYRGLFIPIDILPVKRLRMIPNAGRRAGWNTHRRLNNEMGTKTIYDVPRTNFPENKRRVCVWGEGFGKAFVISVS